LKTTEQAKQLGAALLATWMLGKNTAFSDHRSYAQLLVALAEPKAVAVILEHLESAESAWIKAQKPLSDPLQLGPQEKQIWFARVLCEAPSAHFTADQRKRYFRWFDEIAPQLKGGNNFSKFIEAIRKRAVAQWPQTEQDAIEKTHQLALLKLKDQQPTVAIAPVRNFVKSYQMADLENELGRVKAGRHFARGEEIYTSQLCGKCHLINGSGGNVGPDLSAVGGRFTAKDMLEAMIDPSKVISEQYAAAIVETKTEMHMGLIAGETEQELTLFADPYGETKKTLPKSSITKREAAKISLMPVGLLNSLQVDEILDLLAYLQSGGKADAPNFKATP
jgi:putative heme-binding domain-containing protein